MTIQHACDCCFPILLLNHFRAKFVVVQAEVFIIMFDQDVVFVLASDEKFVGVVACGAGL